MLKKKRFLSSKFFCLEKKPTPIDNLTEKEKIRNEKRRNAKCKMQNAN